MRALAVTAALFVAAGGIWLDASATDLNLARVQGAYTTAPAANPAACARLCADDGLCIAWTLRPSGECSLTAIAAPGVTETGAVSGYSERAPASLRAAAAIAAPQPVPLPAPPLRATTDAVFEAPAPPAESAPEDFALLGGPEGK